MEIEKYTCKGLYIGLAITIFGSLCYLIYVLKHKKFFFGWGNIKFVIVELIKTFSNKPSFFASKRIERGLFVMSGLGSIVYYMIVNIHKLSSGEVIALSSVLLACGGYLLKQTQAEKELLSKMPLSVREQVEKVEKDAITNSVTDTIYNSTDNVNDISNDTANINSNTDNNANSTDTENNK